MKGILAIVLLAASLSAQESIHYASVSGRVTDPSNAIVPDAQVTAVQAGTNLKYTQVTDHTGRFRFPYLRLGQYRVSVHKPGFAEATQSVELSAGSAFELPFALKLGSSDTSITVTEQSAVLEANRSQIAGTLNQREAQAVPLNGRNLFDLALFVPGVSPTNTASTQLFAETSAVPGQGISIGSQRNFSNSYIVDGLSANDDAAGVAGMFYGLDTVHEFQVVTTGGQAEFGRAMSGYVNVVTRSGSNNLHGSLYGYFRNQRLNTNNPLLGSKLPLTQAQEGISVGGPIIPNRTFYFTNYEERDLNQSGLITIAPANITAINSRLAAVGYKGSLLSTGLYPNPVHLRNYLAKMDHQFSAADQFSLRYSLYDVDSNNSRGAGALSAVSAAAGLNNIDQTIAASNVWVISPTTVNETRGQFTYSSLQANPNDSFGPAVTISGIASFGTLSGSPTARQNRLYEIVDNLSRRQGTHALRIGVDLLYNADSIIFPRSINGSYSFSSLANFLSGVYNNQGYTQTFGNSSVSQGNSNIGMFIQDEWKATPNLTFNAGFRYDLQFLETIATEKSDVSPRVGFAWSPTASRDTVVRGGAGLFYDRIPLRALANALLSSDNTTTITAASQLSLSLSPAQLGAPIFPNILPAVPVGALGNITTMDPNMKHAYGEQASLEVEHQFGSRSTISVGAQHLRGRHLILSVNQNVPGCTASGTNNGCRPISTFANDSQYSPRADSQYDGLYVSFLNRPTKWGSVRLTYNFSKSLDDVSEFFFSAPMNNFNIRQDWARSDDDQRHRFTADGTLHLPGKFDFSGSLQYYSKLPFNITTGSNTIQGTAARPTIGGLPIGRNLGVGFNAVNTNLRLSRSFKFGERLRLEGLVESFNLMNHRNNMVPNGTFGAGAYPSAPNGSFGTPGAVGESRSVQLALRLNF